MGGDIGKVLQRYIFYVQQQRSEAFTESIGYGDSLPISCQMIRNCKTLKISLPNLLPDIFTASEASRWNEEVFMDNGHGVEGKAGEQVKPDFFSLHTLCWNHLWNEEGKESLFQILPFNLFKGTFHR